MCDRDSGDAADRIHGHRVGDPVDDLSALYAGCTEVSDRAGCLRCPLPGPGWPAVASSAAPAVRYGAAHRVALRAAVVRGAARVLFL